MGAWLYREELSAARSNSLASMMMMQSRDQSLSHGCSIGQSFKKQAVVIV